MTGLSKILPIVLYVLLGISALLGILFYVDVVDTELILTWCYILMGIATAAAIVFPIITMAKNPKAAKSALIGVGALAAVYIIAYVLSSNEVTPLYEKFGIGAGESKLVSSGLITFYILAFLAIVSIVSSGFMKIFK